MLGLHVINMHKSEMINALRCTNTHVISIVNCILSASQRVDNKNRHLKERAAISIVDVGEISGYM